MSLRDFHIVFINAAALCSICFACWAIRQYASEPRVGYLMTACAAFMVAIGLGVYEFLFIRRVKE